MILIRLSLLYTNQLSNLITLIIISLFCFFVETLLASISFSSFISTIDLFFIKFQNYSLANSKFIFCMSLTSLRLFLSIEQDDSFQIRKPFFIFIVHHIFLVLQIFHPLAHSNYFLVTYYYFLVFIVIFLKFHSHVNNYYIQSIFDSIFY